MRLHRNRLLLLPGLLFILLNGCTTITSQHENQPASNTMDSKSIIDESVIDDPLSEQIAVENDYSAPSAKALQNTSLNLWDRIPQTYQLSNISSPHIKKQIKRNLKHAHQLEKISARATPYLYLIVEEVEKRGMPGELALLPFVESSFKPHAYSRKKAAGLWQFIPATGKHFGLKQTWWYDGRRDVLLSTNAALDYLQQLSQFYNNDWLLALAAYNAGIGNVNKAIRKNKKLGKPIDYWSLPLPRETRNYVPKLLATADLIKNYKKYNISLSPIANKPYLTKVEIDSQIDLNVVSDMTGLTVNQLHSYNPALNRWATDPDGPHHLLVPSDKAKTFSLQLAKLDDKDRVRWARHKVKSGDTLSSIARKYQVSVQSIKTTNHLRNSRIRSGKYLLIPSPAISDSSLILASVSQTAAHKRKSPTSDINTYTVKQGDSFWLIAKKHKMSHQRLASINGLSISTPLTVGQQLLISEQGKSSLSASAGTKKITYKVRKGDSLYVISRRFNVSVNELKQWNKLEQKEYIQPGQRIQVFVDPANQTI